MVSSKRSSSLVWCLLLAGFLLAAAAEVAAGRVQKQEEGVGSKSGNGAQCVQDNCKYLYGEELTLCERDCCVRDECHGRRGVDRMECQMECDRKNAAAASLHEMRPLKEDGSEIGIVLAGIAQCAWDNCQGLEGMKRRVCETKCCVSNECQGLSGVDRMACNMKCDNTYGAAAAGSFGINILQVV